MSKHLMLRPESCILLDNPSAHVCKALKNDFHNQQSLLQRINSQRVNSDHLDSWIKWRLVREEELNWTRTFANVGNGYIEESNGHLMLSGYK